MAAIAARRPVSLTLDTRQLEPVAVALALAAGIELLILRAFTRTAMHIPALEQLAKPYEVVSFAGRYAYYVAAVLLVLALPLAVASLWSRGDVSARATAAGVSAFAIFATLARLGIGSPAAVDFLTVASVLVVAAAAAGRLRPRAALAAMLFGTGFVLLAGHSLLQSAIAEGAEPIDGRPLLWSGEIVAIGFALSTPWTLSALPGRRSLIAAGVVGLLTFGVFVGNGSTTKILLLWNEGLAGVFPSALYGLAVATMLAAGAGLIARHDRMSAVALVLLVCGGFGLHSTYQTGLIVVALSVLALSQPRLSVARLPG